MAYLNIGDPEVDNVVGDILLVRTPTFGAIEYHIITDAGIIVDVVDPNNPGGTALPLAQAVGYLWPRGDGTPAGS